MTALTVKDLVSILFGDSLLSGGRNLRALAIFGIYKKSETFDVSFRGPLLWELYVNHCSWQKETEGLLV